MGTALDITAVIVQFVHDFVRDAIAEVVGSILSYAIELIVSVGTALPLVLEQIATRVASLIGKVSRNVTDLITSARNLVTKLGDLKALFKALQDKLDSLFRGGKADAPAPKSDTTRTDMSPAPGTSPDPSAGKPAPKTDDAPDGAGPGKPDADPKKSDDAKPDQDSSRADDAAGKPDDADPARTKEEEFKARHRPPYSNEVSVEAPPKNVPFGKGRTLEPNTRYSVEGRGDFYTDDLGRISHVEADSAVRRGGELNPDLNNPLPNATYSVDGKFHYTTDEYARTIRVEVDRLDVIPDTDRVRNLKIQKDVGDYGNKAAPVDPADPNPPDNTPKYHYDGGHLIGTQFGGPPESINLHPQIDYINRGTQGHWDESFRAWEASVARNPDGFRDIKIEAELPKPKDPDNLTGPDRTPSRTTTEHTDESGTRIVKKYRNK